MMRWVAWLGRVTGVVALLAATAANAQIVPAARVNGAPISMDRLDRQYEELLRERRIHLARMNNPAQAKSIKREALEQLIRVELLYQEGVSAGIVVDDAEVERALASYRAGFRNADTYRRRLELLGFDEATWRVQVRKTLVGDRYAERVVTREVEVSDQDLEDFYRINSRLFKRDEQLRARHILVAVAPDASAQARDQARRKIDDLAARARAGESFDALARQNSDDPTRQWGGELDPFGRGAMPKAFEDAAFALRPGELSAPVETPQGWHLILLDERLAASSMPLDAAMRAKIRAYLRATRGKEAIDREVEQLRGIGKVEILTPL
jgi:parvulin-like peptidyl-prolyl isomerase